MKYQDTISILDKAYDDPSFDQALASVGKKKLRKDGGYKATISYKDQGVYICLSYTDGAWMCDAVMFFAEGSEPGFDAYDHTTESGISLSQSRTDIHDALGTPSLTGGGGPMIMNVIVDYPWDRYDFGSYSVRFEYETDGEKLRKVTALSASYVSRLPANK